MGDIFDGIDLEDLANSEEAIIEPSNLSAPPSITELNSEKGEEVKTETTKEAIPVVGEIDLEALAQLEEAVDAEKIEVNDEEDGKVKGENINPFKTPADDKSSSPSSQETLTSLASALTEAGVFSSLTEEDIKNITDTESLLEAVGKQTKNARYADLNDQQKQYLEAMENGIPHAEYASAAADLDKYKQISDAALAKNPAVAKELIKRSFLIRDFSTEDADKYATLAMRDPSALSDAVKAKQALINFEENKINSKLEAARASKEQALTAERTKLEELKSKVAETSEILPGIKINSTTKDKVFNSMTSIVELEGDNPKNEVMKSYSEDAEYKLKLHAMHVLTKGFTDFSKLKAASKSKAVQDLKNKLDQTGAGKTGSSGGIVQDHITNGSTSGSLVEQLKKKNF